MPTKAIIKKDNKDGAAGAASTEGRDVPIVASNTDSTKQQGKRKRNKLVEVTAAHGNTDSAKQQQDTSQKNRKRNKLFEAASAIESNNNKTSKKSSGKNINHLIEIYDKLSRQTMFDVSFKDFCTAFLPDYSNEGTSLLSQRQIEINKKRYQRYRVILFKGQTQFQSMFGKYKATSKDAFPVAVLEENANFTTYLLDFYKLIFDEEQIHKEIDRLVDDVDTVHLLLVGILRVPSSQTDDANADIYRLKPVAALSFSSYLKDNCHTVFLKWIGISVDPPFNGNKEHSFRNMGIGSFMMITMQRISSKLLKINDKDTTTNIVVVQSGEVAEGFYKFGMGFMNISSGQLQLLPPKITNAFLINQYLPILAFQGDLQMCRPKRLKSQPNSMTSLRDNIIVNLFNVDKKHYDFRDTEVFSELVAKSSEKHNNFFRLHSNEILEQQINVGTSLRDQRRATFEETSTIMHKIFKFTEEEARFQLINPCAVGLFVLRSFIYELIKNKMHTKKCPFQLHKNFLDLRDDSGLELERQFMTTYLWLASKIDTKVPPIQFSAMELYQCVRTMDNETWIDEEKLERAPTEWEKFFMIGSLIGDLSNTISKETVNQTENGCSPEYLQELFRIYGKSVSVFKTETNTDVFFHFISRIFGKRIAILYFKQSEQLASDNCLQWIMEYTIFAQESKDVGRVLISNQETAKLSFQADVVLCPVAPTEDRAFDEKEVLWFMLTKPSAKSAHVCDSYEDAYRGTLLASMLFDLMEDDEDFFDPNSARTLHESMQVNCFYNPVEGSEHLHPHCWLIKALTSDNEPWDSNFINSYVGLLSRKCKELNKNDIFLTLMNSTQVENTENERKRINYDAFSVIGVVYHSDNHFVTVFFERVNRLVFWYDSSDVVASDEKETIQDPITKMCTIFNIFQDGKYELKKRQTAKTTRNDCGPIALDDMEFHLALENFAVSENATILQRKNEILSRYCTLYMDYLLKLDGVDEDTRREALTTTAGLVNYHFRGHSSSRIVTVYQCAGCSKHLLLQDEAGNVKKDTNNVVVMRNCSSFCVFHEKCYRRKHCQSCKFCGNFDTTYALRREKDDSVLVQGNKMLKFIQVGTTYGTTEATEMFNERDLEEAKALLPKTVVDVGLNALDPDYSNPEPTFTYFGIDQYKILTLRKSCWLSCDVMVRVSKILQADAGDKAFFRVVSEYDSSTISFLEENVFYMFMVNVNNNHWLLVETDGTTNVFIIWGALQTLEDTKTLFCEKFANVCNVDSIFQVGGKGAEKQDGNNCGIIVLRRIEVRTRDKNFDNRMSPLSGMSFVKLGTYNCSRIKYASLIAKWPTAIPDVSNYTVDGDGSKKENPIVVISPSKERNNLGQSIEEKKKGDGFAVISHPLVDLQGEDLIVESTLHMPSTSSGQSTNLQDESGNVEDVPDPKPMRLELVATGATPYGIPLGILEEVANEMLTEMTSFSPSEQLQSSQLDASKQTSSENKPPDTQPDDDRDGQALTTTQSSVQAKPLSELVSNIIVIDDTIPSDKQQEDLKQVDVKIDNPPPDANKDPIPNVRDDDSRTESDDNDSDEENREKVHTNPQALPKPSGNDDASNDDNEDNDDDVDNVPKASGNDDADDDDDDNDDDDTASPTATSQKPSVQDDDNEDDDSDDDDDTGPPAISENVPKATGNDDADDDDDDDDDTASPTDGSPPAISEKSSKEGKKKRNRTRSKTETKPTKKQKTDVQQKGKRNPMPSMQSMPPTPKKSRSITEQEKDLRQREWAAKVGSVYIDEKPGVQYIPNPHGTTIMSSEERERLYRSGVNNCVMNVGNSKKLWVERDLDTDKFSSLFDDVKATLLPDEITFKETSEKLYKEYLTKSHFHQNKILHYQQQKRQLKATKNNSDFIKKSIEHVSAQIAMHQEKIDNELHMLANEAFFRHPDSIFAIRRKPDKAYLQYEAITNKCFRVNGKLRRIVYPITEKYVKERFHPDFVQKVNDLLKDEFVYFKKSYQDKNLTVESKQLAKEIKDYLSFNVPKIEMKYRGENPVLLCIMKVKLVQSYVGDNNFPSESKWLIRNIPKTNLENKSMAQTLSTWIKVDEDLIFSPEGMGQEKASSLRSDCENKRKQYLKRNFSLTSKSEWFCESFEFSYEGVPIDKIPQYKFEDKQVSSIRWSQKDKTFYGQFIENATAERQRIHARETTLLESWVQTNFSQVFLDKVKARGKDGCQKFLFVPAGSASKRDYPLQYDKRLPPIEYQQEDRDTCATSSFASCLSFLGHTELSEWIELFGRCYILNSDADQDKILSCLVSTLMREKPEFNKQFCPIALKQNKFDIFNISTERRSNPMLLQLLGIDGGIGHAITIHNNLIYDSNLEHAVELNKFNLEFCIDAVYIGIIKGYEFISRTTQIKMSRNGSKKKKKQKKACIKICK